MKVCKEAAAVNDSKTVFLRLAGVLGKSYKYQVCMFDLNKLLNKLLWFEILIKLRFPLPGGNFVFVQTFIICFIVVVRIGTFILCLSLLIFPKKRSQNFLLLILSNSLRNF